jgi:hypothetical protein
MFYAPNMLEWRQSCNTMEFRFCYCHMAGHGLITVLQWNFIFAIAKWQDLFIMNVFVLGMSGRWPLFTGNLKEGEGSLFLGGIQREWMEDPGGKGPKCSTEVLCKALYRQGACKIGSTTRLWGLCQHYQGCLSVRPSVSSVCPSVTSDKVHVRPISKYSSIFEHIEHILENIHRICPLRPIPNRQNRPSVRPSRPSTTSLLPNTSDMTTLPSTPASATKLELPLPLLLIPLAQ